MKRLFKSMSALIAIALVFSACGSKAGVQSSQGQGAYGFQSVNHEGEAKLFTYPLTPEDPEWRNYGYIEHLEMCNMPEELLVVISSDELADLVLSYPFLSEGVGGFKFSIINVDTYKMGLEVLAERSNIITEFFSREEATEILLKKYEELNVNYNMLIAPNPEMINVLRKSGFTKECFLQTYFATIAKDLTAEEKQRLKNILEIKQDQKAEICDEFPTYSYILFNYLQWINGEIPTDIIPVNMYNKVMGIDDMSLLSNSALLY